jgi:hypothetical protein
MSTDKTREQRLRRMAARQGLRLVRSRLRDPWAVGYGQYGLIDPSHGGTVNPVGPTGQPTTWTLDDVEEYLTSGE